MDKEGERLGTIVALCDRGIVNEDGRGRCVLRNGEELSGDGHARRARRASPVNRHRVGDWPITAAGGC